MWIQGTLIQLEIGPSETAAFGESAFDKLNGDEGSVKHTVAYNAK
jgi:hypothetical protein